MKKLSEFLIHLAGIIYALTLSICALKEHSLLAIGMIISSILFITGYFIDKQF